MIETDSHLQSFVQEVVPSFQAVVVFIRITPVSNQEHQGLKHTTQTHYINNMINMVTWLHTEHFSDP